MSLTRGLKRYMALAVLLVLASAAGACGGGETISGGLTDASGLRGRGVGVVELAGPSTLETRYVLQENYGLNVDLADGDVSFPESTAESLLELLRSDSVDAVVLPPLSAYHALEEEDLRVLTHVTEEMRDLSGAPILNSILVTYPDLGEQKLAALGEVNRLLMASMIYFRANEDDVIAAVAESESVDEEYLRWWWDRWDVSFGELSADTVARLTHVWEAALAIGDLASVPELADALLTPVAVDSAEPTEGDRTTVSIALLDDPTRRIALYAIELGIVTSDSVDLNLAYLPLSGIAEAVPARHYDVIETTPMAIPSGEVRDFAVVVLSGGLLDLDGTLLFVRNEDES